MKCPECFGSVELMRDYGVVEYIICADVKCNWKGLYIDRELTAAINRLLVTLPEIGVQDEDVGGNNNSKGCCESSN